MKVTVVVTTFNSEKTIEATLRSVREVSNEIIVVDGTSSDSTLTIVKKYTDKIFVRENHQMLNINKNFGFSKAASEWILCLDSDECVTPELSEEILKISEHVNVNGYFIPRKNIIFGKWIEHTGWYPDPQLRLFRKGTGRFEEKHVHEFIKIEGEVETLSNPMTHLNYESIDQFLNKMIKIYTVSEAENLIRGGYKYNPFDIIRMPLSEFLKRYFAEQGYKDGMHGLVLSALMAFYHLVVFLKIWEKNNYPDNNDSYALIEKGSRVIARETGYWIAKKKMDSESNPLKKQIFRIKRKIVS